MGIMDPPVLNPSVELCVPLVDHLVKLCIAPMKCIPSLIESNGVRTPSWKVTLE